MINNKIKKLSYLTLIIFASCSLAPKYTKPNVTSDIDIPKINNDHEINKKIEAYKLGWKDYFQDKALQQLIEIALQNNRDLKLASLKVKEAMAQYNISRADLVPKLNASGSLERQRIRDKTKTKAPFDIRTTQDTYSAGAQIGGSGAQIGYELDFFAKLINLNQADLNKFFATQYAQDIAKITLITGVAKAYYGLATAKEGMKLAQNNVANFSKMIKLNESLYKYGMISKYELALAKASVEEAQNLYYKAENTYKKLLNSLAILIGQKLNQDFESKLSLNDQFLKQDIPTGIPSEVMLNRPDIKIAEEQLKASNAMIGAARAAFFPRITLTAKYGSGSNELGNLFNAGSLTSWSFIPTITVPIFNAGVLKTNLDLAKIGKEKSIIEYEQSIQNAFKEIADGLNNYDSLRKQYNSTLIIYNAEKERARIKQIRYKNGMDKMSELLLAQSNALQKEEELIQTKLKFLENKIDLYKILGGGLIETNDNINKPSKETIINIK